MSPRLAFSAFVVLLLSIVVSPVYAQRTLETPQPDSFQSGIGVISGWACNAQTIEISFNGGPPQEAGYGTSRGDTAGVCGDSDTGFGLLYNWNLLGDGVHTVSALADGVEFASATVIVTTLGSEFLSGVRGAVPVPDFPTPGQTRTLRWQESPAELYPDRRQPQRRGHARGSAACFREPGARLLPEWDWADFGLGVCRPDHHPPLQRRAAPRGRLRHQPGRHPKRRVATAIMGLGCYTTGICSGMVPTP